jgi:hypothetical protein
MAFSFGKGWYKPYLEGEMPFFHQPLWLRLCRVGKGAIRSDPNRGSDFGDRIEENTHDEPP